MAYDAKFRGYQPAANWTAENPVLEQFTIGYESDTGKTKCISTMWTPEG